MVASTSTSSPTSPSTTTVTTTVAAAPTVSPPAVTPESIAAELTVVERGLRDPAATPADLDALGRRQQAAFRRLADHPEWDAAVVELVDTPHRPAVQLTIDARRAVAAHSAGRPATPPPTTLPAWTIVEPLPAAELLALYREAELLTGVPWAYLAAINFVETRVGRIVGESPDGAIGPMQFLPSTWADCCTGDPTVVGDAILGAAVYLRANGAPADMLGALDAYNPNAGYVGAVDAYARNLLADERAFLGYHAWEVYVPTSAGTVRLPVGFSSDTPIDAAAYLADHPESRAS
jgi:membrane-bound lytic murein transglycosylase B